MNVSSQTRHFVFTPDGRIREFSPEQAARVAAGAGKVPEFADHSLRYLQVTVVEEADEEDIKVATAGASLRFDGEGRLTEAGPMDGDTGSINSFEQETCVQWALRDLPASVITYH
ncbi:MAG TPA: hypothetical protein VM369_04370 [Candidatus Binatia bacterium]|nr:hypothetical protein [Candidatus Binatia bacterium]